VPLALLIVGVMWSGRSSTTASNSAQVEPASQVTTVAQAGKPQVQGS